MTDTQGYTLKDTAEALGTSEITVRRYIKNGKVKAHLVDGKYGKTYMIDELPQDLIVKNEKDEKGLAYSSMINRLEQLNQEVGYWRGKAEELQKQLLLLEAPKVIARRHWWQRLFKA
jgi:predicted site-specific integrase-resolvase